MKKFLSILIVLIFANPLFAQLSLEDSKLKARQNYPLIQQYALIEQSEEFNLSNASKAFLPQLSVTGIFGVIEGMPSFSPPGTEPSSNNFNAIGLVQVNQAIWDGGMTKSNKEIIRAQSGLDSMQLELKMEGLDQRIEQIYFGLLLIKEQQNQLELLEKVLKSNEERVKNAYENGVVYKSDWEEIQVELLKLNQQVSELKYREFAYRQVLSAFIGEEVNESQMLLKPEIELSLNDSIQGTKRALFEGQRDLVKSYAQLNKSKLNPKIGLMGVGVLIEPGVAFGTSELSNILVAGLSLRWELGPLYQNKNRKSLTEVQLQMIESEEEAYLFNSRLSLYQENAEVKKYQSFIQQDESIVELRQNIKNSYQVRYDNGDCTMSELIRRIQDENLALQQLNTHEIQYLMAAYQYQNTLGK